MPHTQAELEPIYAEKMAGWSDNRVRYELTYKDAAGDAWASPEVMAAWNKCLAAEVERRGLTA